MSLPRCVCGAPLLHWNPRLSPTACHGHRTSNTIVLVEAEVHAVGAVPATIAIIDGQLKVGLSEEELERLGRGGDEIGRFRDATCPFW